MYVLFGQNELNGLYFENDSTEEEKKKEREKENEMENERKMEGENKEYHDDESDESDDEDNRDIRCHDMTLLGVFSNIENAYSWKDRCPLFDHFFLHYDVVMDTLHKEPMKLIERNRKKIFSHNSYYTPRGGKYRGSTTNGNDIYTLVLIDGYGVKYGGTFSTIEIAKKFSNLKSNSYTFLMAHKIDVGFVNYKKERSVYLEDKIKRITCIINKNRHLCDKIIEKYKNESEIKELLTLFDTTIKRSCDGFYGFHNGSLHRVLCKCCKHFTREDIIVFINFCNYVQTEAIGRVEQWEYLEFSRLIKFKK